jgi:putative addiction module CopG family antidote
MTLHISPELEQFVEQEIASGHFPDRDAVVAYALRMLKHDREEAVLGIQAGLADVAAGRVESLAVAFDELRREFNVRRGT